MTNSEKAIEILQRTNDGRQLFQTEKQIQKYGRNGDGWQLAILQDAVNGELNEKGEMLFDALHKQVLAGDFRYPLKDFVSKFLPQVQLAE